MKIKDLEVGTQVVCVNQEGWGCFIEGETYYITEIWEYGTGVDINGHEVADNFFNDFEVVEA